MGWLLSIIFKSTTILGGRVGSFFIRGGIVLAVVAAIYTTGRLHEARQSAGKIADINAEWQEALDRANAEVEADIERARDAVRSVSPTSDDLAERLRQCAKDPDCIQDKES